jgi:hypothetical protein
MGTSLKLRLFPATLKQAKAMVLDLHRHHKPPVGHRFSIGCEDQFGKCHGIAVVGRPVARLTEQYRIAEVTRLVTDGTPHVCSKLYAACARATQAMGYDSIQTSILDSESGVSLVAAGWLFDHITKGESWVRTLRARRTDQPMCDKKVYKKCLQEPGITKGEIRQEG